MDFEGDPDDDDPEDDDDPADDEEPDDDDEESEEEEVLLVSLFGLEALESPLLLSLCEPVAPLSCFPPAEELGFDKLGSFNLFE